MPTPVLTIVPPTDPDSVAALKAWSKYLRRYDLRNEGGGSAKLFGDKYDIVANIQLREDGTIDISAGDQAKADAKILQPKDDEQRLFKSNYAAIIEQSIPAKSVNPKIVGLPDDAKPGATLPAHVAKRTVFEYPSIGAPVPEISMVVIRDDFTAEYIAEKKIEGKGGWKQCVPWFYYEDTHTWEAGLPIGIPTPLFADPVEGIMGLQIMVHEGEKACLAAIAAAKTGSGHPWQPFLGKFCHIAWQGGALTGAVERANWSLINNSEKTVYIMPDNDVAGYEVAAKLRAQLGKVKTLRVIHWRSVAGMPESWDMAAPFPMVGPEEEKPIVTADRLAHLFSLFMNAEERFLGDDGKPHYRVRKEFAERFRQIIGTDEIVEFDKSRGAGVLMQAKTFNSTYHRLAPNIRNLFTAITAMDQLGQNGRPGYQPTGSIRGGRFVADFGPVEGSSSGASPFPPLNMYRPPILMELEPRPTASGKWRETEKSIRPFLVYLHHLIPDEPGRSQAITRKNLIRWACNNMVARKPGDRVPWATLLVSKTQGSGKTTLGAILARLLGDQNVSNVAGNQLSETFNGYLENKQLVLIEELKEDSSFKVYEALKAPISNAVIPIRRMHTDSYDTENHASVLAMSNHMSALSVPNEDRRWFMPGVTELLKPVPGSNLDKMARRYLADQGGDSFWSGFYRWLDDKGAAHLLWYMRRYGLQLHNTPRNWPVRKGETESGLWRNVQNRAPMTEAKKVAISRSGASWVRLVEEKLQVEEDGLAHVIVIQDIKNWLRDKHIRFNDSDVETELSDTGVVGYRLFIQNPDSDDPKAKRGFRRIFQGGNLPKDSKPQKVQVMIRADLFDTLSAEIIENPRSGWQRVRESALHLISQEWTNLRNEFLGMGSVGSSAKPDPETAAKATDMAADPDAVF